MAKKINDKPHISYSEVKKFVDSHQVPKNEAEIRKRILAHDWSSGTFTIDRGLIKQND